MTTLNNPNKKVVQLSNFKKAVRKVVAFPNKRATKPTNNITPPTAA